MSKLPLSSACQDVSDTEALIAVIRPLVKEFVKRKKKEYIQDFAVLTSGGMEKFMKFELHDLLKTVEDQFCLEINKLLFE